MKDKQPAFVEKSRRQANHHLSLAALRFPIDDERCTIGPIEAFDCTSDCSLDAVNLFSLVRQPFQLSPVLSFGLFGLLEPVRIEPRLWHRSSFLSVAR